MNHTTLISAEELATTLDDCVVVDCRHDLFDLEAGRRGYAAGHIPGARFLHQDTDLASEKNGRNGRHPLPSPDRLLATLAGLGLTDDRQLVACDEGNGQFAVRLWWLARWLGHEKVAVLDGGVAAWSRAGFPLVQGDAPGGSARPAPSGGLTRRRSLAPAVTAEALLPSVADRPLIVDARAGERYRGEKEPLDPVAGHIPGAINRPLASNLRGDGRFKPAEVLRAEFEMLLAGRDPSGVVHQCGSGVTACHNLLAMEHAGLAGSALYPGSWSEWVADPSRPVAVGPNP